MWLAFAWLANSIGVYSETSEVQIVPSKDVAKNANLPHLPPTFHVVLWIVFWLTAATARHFFLVQTGGLSHSPMHVYSHLRAHTHTRSQETSAQTRSEFFFLFRDYGYAFSWLCSP